MYAYNGGSRNNGRSLGSRVPRGAGGGRFSGQRSQYSGGFSGRSNRGGGKIKSWPVRELEQVVAQLNKEVATYVEEPKYVAKHSFNDFEISQKLKSNILAKGYREPTPIQDRTIPALINGRDVIGMANTGTGKTAAFLIPLIELASRNKTRKTLILTPTRELATQIYEEFRAFSQGMFLYAAVLIGGANIERQKRELSKQPSFVIATPGRLKDLLKQHAIRLGDYSAVVLDETDRMVDIGFIEDIKYFISLIPTKRQSLFFSATVSPKVETILNAFVKDPVTVSVKRHDAAVNIAQEIVRVPVGGNKIDALHKILTSEDCQKAIVFGSTKWGVQKLADALQTRGRKAGAIHGNKSQNQRLSILKQFKRNEISVLLATDVASRGLDIDNVTHVINYDMPESYDAYIHRIGRTGRADKKGVALTII